MLKQTIRLVVTDLDDTLLNPKKEISLEAIKTINQVREQGVLFTFITGRPPFATKRFAERIKLEGPLVCCNGAMIVNGEEVLFKDTFSLLPLRSMLETMAGLGLTVLIFDGEFEYILQETSWSQGRDVPLWPRGDRVWEEKQGVKIAVFAGKSRDEFRSFTPDLTNFAKEYSIALYGDSGCEIVAKGVNKAIGLAKLSEYLSIKLPNIMAIGDNANDFELLQEAGIGVAVANAVASTKAVADYVCQEKYTDGVVEALRRFVIK